MNDFDVLVPTGKLEPALTALRAIGWTPVALPNGRGFSRAATGLYHSWGFRNESTRGELDLHWHASADSCQRDADRAFWSASLPFAVGAQATRTLCTTDLLLSILVHAYASHDPVIRWVADAAMSLSNKLARLWFWNWRLRGHAPSLSTAASFPGFLRRYTAH